MPNPKNLQLIVDGSTIPAAIAIGVIAAAFEKSNIEVITRSTVTDPQVAEIIETSKADPETALEVLSDDINVVDCRGGFNALTNAGFHSLIRIPGGYAAQHEGADDVFKALREAGFEGRDLGVAVTALVVGNTKTNKNDIRLTTELVEQIEGQIESYISTMSEKPIAVKLRFHATEEYRLITTLSVKFKEEVPDFQS